MKTNRHPIVRQLPRLGAVLLLASMVVGCPDKKKSQLAVQGKPALELKKCISFPLIGSQLPDTKQELVDQITGGLRGRVDIPQDVMPVMADGTYPKFQRL